MAATNVTPEKIPQNGAVEYTLVAIDATDGAYIDFTGKGQRIVILLENTSATTAGTVTIVQGDGIQGVADIEVSIPTSTLVAVSVESGSFKITDGASENKGCVHIEGPATVSVAAVEMP